MSNPATFSDRLRIVLDAEESALAFARKSDVGESLLRRYLSGSEPGLDKLVRIASAASVRLEWLATGEGPMRAAEMAETLAPAVESATGPDALLPMALDHDFGGEVCAAILELYRAENARLSTKQIMAIGFEKYEEIASTAETPEERQSMLKLVLSQLRKDLRSGKSATTQGKRSA